MARAPDIDWKARAATYRAVLLDSADLIETVSKSAPLQLPTRVAMDAQAEAIRDITAE